MALPLLIAARVAVAIKAGLTDLSYQAVSDYVGMTELLLLPASGDYHVGLCCSVSETGETFSSCLQYLPVAGPLQAGPSITST